MQIRTYRSIFPITRKKRIEWFLTLPHVVKRLRNRISPPVPTLKKRSRFFEGKTLESALGILHQNMSLLNHSKILAPAQLTSSYHRDKVWPLNLNSGKFISNSSTPILVPREYHILPKLLQLTTKLDHRFPVTPPFEHNPKRYRVPVEQLTSIRKLSPSTTGESLKFAKKAFAPVQVHLPSSLYINDKLQEATQPTRSFRAKSIPVNRYLKVTGSDSEHSLPDNLNGMPVQETESAVNQDQPSINPNASASTLYLDGLSLGRWAIQHLERVLSKPPSGITGVDPRATVPRGRVAPF